MSPVVSHYLEAMLLLFPPEAGGRFTPIAPRDGSYRPFACIEGFVGRLRVIEGPPLLAPGDEARVMVEIEDGAGSEVRAGAEIVLLEHDERQVGILTVTRVCRKAVPA
jgi:hypothetical protein